MANKTMVDEIRSYGLIPVIKIDDPAQAEPLAQALCDGGLPAAEVTFRTAAAKEAIARMTKAFPDMLVGAGTVLTTKQVDEAVEAGAKFIVSPGLNPKVVSYCIEKGVPIMPGCATPSDMEAAIELGLDVVKFFPAEANGGIKSIKAMAAPYTQLRFMPTGGINEKNLLDYLSFPKIIACGGSFMVNEDLLKAGDYAAITELTRNAVRLMLGFELAHIGINAENEEEAKKGAAMFQTLFGFTAKEGNSSIFAGKEVELMKSPYLGKNGHIAISTNSIDRAVAFFERKGFAFNQDSAKYDAKKNLKAIYFADEVCGFAIHLVQK
ncbi:MAG: bifunctional 4-hydroxy-2-oxoglutarate aldolase/2-dehydro-3-deoxy-phosphogluconate aldolase [Candidatus Merdivicinus sp.]|jgi:2-dehydro-3-deoxyphosphogluconate aldolase/(4S)-4-hydroxy-2-oxoglutarate aldolase